MSKRIHLTAEELHNVAKLARLSLTEEELEKTSGDLQNVLAHFSHIQGVDTAGVATADDSSGLTNVSREDIASPHELCDSQDLLARAPKTRDGHIEVDAVF